MASRYAKKDTIQLEAILLKYPLFNLSSSVTTNISHRCYIGLIFRLKEPPKCYELGVVSSAYFSRMLGELMSPELFI